MAYGGTRPWVIPARVGTGVLGLRYCATLLLRDVRYGDTVSGTELFRSSTALLWYYALATRCLVLRSMSSTEVCRSAAIWCHAFATWLGVY
eukprot:2551829-Rhodomonas_salina.1